MATITFTPIIPLAFSRAFFSSSLSPRILASPKLLESLLYKSPNPALEITPMPPSFATAEARPDKDFYIINSPALL
jgi:hypothetical protein